MRENSDRLILASVQRSLAEARLLCPMYGGDAAPLGEGQLVDLVRQAGCGVERFRFRSSRGAFAFSIGGVVEIALNASVPRRLREFALRHELHHVLAGDVADAVHGPVFFNDQGYMTSWERAADLFALVDFVPGRELAAADNPALLTRARLAEIASYWPEPENWAADRTALRLALWAASKV